MGKLKTTKNFVNLSALLQEILESMSRQRKIAQSLQERCQIILLLNERYNNEIIAQKLSVNRHTVRKWRNRWESERERLLEIEKIGQRKELIIQIKKILADAPRPGTPAKFTSEEIVKIVALGLSTPDESDVPLGHWTPKEIARLAVERNIVKEVSASSVWRFFKRCTNQASSRPKLAKSD